MLWDSSYTLKGTAGSSLAVLKLLKGTIFCLFQDFAIEVIKSTHKFWKALISQNSTAGELNW